MPDTQNTSLDGALDAACLTLLPFLLQAVEGDPGRARAIVADMIRAYDPTDMIELGLITRIVGFTLAAMDNIRLSIADPDMPDAKVLRCRASAASLSRSAEQCRAALNALRAADRPQQPLAAAKTPSMAKAAHPNPAEADAKKANNEAGTVMGHLARMKREWTSTTAMPQVVPQIVSQAHRAVGSRPAAMPPSLPPTISPNLPTRVSAYG